MTLCGRESVSMHLTKEEQAIFDGRQGEGASIALKVLVGIGRVFDAPRLVPIRRAHVALSNQEGDTWFAEKLQKAGGTEKYLTKTTCQMFIMQ